jgi:hypothetical protein
MKTNHARLSPRLAARLAGAALAALPLLTGCQNETHVIASTATVIGVQIGQAPADATPSAKLGYNRAEFAYVPTNRTTKSDVEKPAGAEESADVIMELRYGGTKDNSIYQRLAVGKNAVSQAGAALMFAKAADGTLTDEQTKTVAAALAAIPTAPIDVLKAGAPLDKAYTALAKDDAKKKVFDEAAKTAGFTSYADFATKRSSATADQVRKIRAELEKDADVKAELDKHTTK